MKKLYSILFISIVFITSCGTLGLVSTPSEYKAAGEAVSAVKKGINIFTLTPMNSQKESGILLKELEGKCTNGVTNIRTTTSLKYFLIVGLEKLEVSGNCK